METSAIAAQPQPQPQPSAKGVVPTDLPRRPDLTPPPAPAPPIPSYRFYLACVAVSLGLIALGFRAEGERWAGLWMNVGSNVLVAVVLLIVIDRRIRPLDLARLPRVPIRGPASAAGAAFEVAAGLVGVVSPTTKHALGYARAVAARLGEAGPPDPFITTDQLASLESAADRHPKGFVLVGPPGGGKTTFLQHLLARAADGAIRHPRTGRLPVMMPLRTWSPGGGVQNLRDTVQSYYAMPTRAFDRLLGRGRFLFLLDGFDEVPPDRQPQVAADLRALRRRHPTNRFVVSTRRNDPLRDVDLPVLTMPGLTDAQRNAILAGLVGRMQS